MVFDSNSKDPVRLKAPSGETRCFIYELMFNQEGALMQWFHYDNIKTLDKMFNDLNTVYKVDFPSETKSNRTAYLVSVSALTDGEAVEAGRAAIKQYKERYEQK